MSALTPTLTRKFSFADPLHESATSPLQRQAMKLIFSSKEDWEKSMTDIVNQETIKVLNDAHLVTEQAAVLNKPIDRAGVEALRASYCLTEFLCWKDRISPVQAAFGGHEIHYLTESSLHKIVLLFSLMMLQKNEVGEDLAFMAEKISILFQKSHPPTLAFQRARLDFDNESMPGSQICKIVISDALVKEKIDRAMIFVSYLSCNNLRVGAAEHLGSFLIKKQGYKMPQIAEITDVLLKDFLLFYLAKNLWADEKKEEFEQCTKMIRKPELWMELEELHI